MTTVRAGKPKKFTISNKRTNESEDEVTFLENLEKREKKKQKKESKSSFLDLTAGVIKEGTDAGLRDYKVKAELS